jgi:hypothetical protein
VRKNPQEPLGTVEELQQHGLDLEKFGSCAKAKSIVDGVAILGCQWHTQKMEGGGMRGCLWSKPEYGAFRGKGPQYVAIYRHLNERTDTGATFCSVHSCFKAEKLWRLRMEQQERTGEKVEVAALQGQKWINRERVPLDPENNKTNDMRMLTIVHQDHEGRCGCGKKGCQKYLVPTFDGFKELGPQAEYEQGLEKMAAQRRRMAALGGVEGGSPVET